MVAALRCGRPKVQFAAVGQWVACQLLTSLLLSLEYAAIYSRELPQYAVAAGTAHVLSAVLDYRLREQTAPDCLLAAAAAAVLAAHVLWRVLAAQPPPVAKPGDGPPPAAAAAAAGDDRLPLQ